MRHHIVLTLTGPDRTGIVDEVTKWLFDLGGNVETSRMARLGGEFAMLMLVAVPAEQAAGLEAQAAHLVAQGYKVTVSETGQSYAAAHAGWQTCQIEVQGADHEGIIHEIAHTLSVRGINIETLDTGIMRAANSGAPLFTMRAVVAIPPGAATQGWEEALEEAGHRLHVDLRVSAAPQG